jgi:hypothetical protein
MRKPFFQKFPGSGDGVDRGDPASAARWRD